MKFTTKLTALFLGIMITVSVAISYSIYISNYKGLEEQIQHRLRDMAFHTMDKIDRTLHTQIEDIELLANDVIISSRDSTPKEITERLIEYRNHSKSYVTLSFFDSDGIRIADTSGLHIGQQNAPVECFNRAREDQSCRNCSVYDEGDFGVPTMNFAAPVKDENGESFGVIIARMPVTKLYEIAKDICGIHEDKSVLDLEINLVDREGLLLYSHYNRGGILKDNLANDSCIRRSIEGEKMGSSICYDALLDEKVICFFVREQGYLDFAGNDWTLLLHIPTKIAFASAIQLRNSMIGILSVVAILTSVISRIFSRTISKPIIKLKNAAVEIGKAKLDTRIDINSKDEIGELAAAFNDMAFNLNNVTASRDALNREIAERKRAKEELQKARDELEVRVKHRTSDLAKANEELRNEIKERKLAEDALRVARDDWENIFESISDIVMILDRDRRVLDCNRFAVASLQKTKKQIVGQFCYDVFQCKEHFEGGCLHEELLVSERPDTIDMEMEMLSGIYLVTIAPVLDNWGKVIKTIHIAKDITNRKKSEKKLLVYQNQLRSLASELLLAEERLRRRIAIDVHDHIGQKLAISKIKIKSLSESISSQKATKVLNEVGDLITQTIESSRSLTFELSPPVLYELGFEAAMEWLVRHTKQQHGLSVNFKDDGNAKPLDNNVRVFLFQAVRELLVNVVKHAQAHHLTVSTQKVNSEIQVDIEDDGIGFEVSQITFNSHETSGFGLFSIRERLGHIGGKLKIESRSGCGTKATLTAPLGRKVQKRGKNK